MLIWEADREPDPWWTDPEALILVSAVVTVLILAVLAVVF